MTKLTADVEGATRLGRRWLQVAADVPRETDEARRDLGRATVPVFAAHALRLSGRLASGIESHDVGGATIVDAEAVDPETGFDYVRVTRFGHRKARLRPTRRKSAASVISTRSGRAAGRRAALRLPGGFRSVVPAFRPKSDWRDRALPEVHRRAEMAATRLGREVASRL